MDGDFLLKTDSKLFASLADHLYDACIVYSITDDTPEAIYANKPFYNLTKFSTEEVIGGDPIFSTLIKKDKNIYNDILKSLKDGTVYENEILCSAGHGVPFWSRLKAVSLDSALQNKDCFAIVLHDISDRKRKETELQNALANAESSNKIKYRFLANMSHEMRTPLNAIMGMAQLLEETALSEEQTEYVEEIILSSDNLLAIINDILEFNFIESGALTLESRKFNIRKQLNQLMDTLGERAEEKNLDFELVISSKVPDELVGDMVRFSQILIHLIGNAIKFTKDGSVSVIVRALKMSNERIPVEIKVKDTGIGIPDDMLDDIFDSFNQASKTTTYKYGGTGLGLSIVHELAGRMDGKLAIEKNNQQGTIFTITIPFELPGSIPRQKQVEPAGDTENPDLFEGSRVLVVDDYKVNRRIVNGMLTKLGCSVDEAETGEIALELIKKNNYSIILMDVHMPGMGGLGTTQKIRELEDDVKSKVPVIAITASVLERDIKECKKAGMDDFVAKPFTKRELISIVKMHIGRSGNQSNVFETIDKQPQERVVDLKNLIEMTGNDQKMLIEMIDIYIGQTSDMMDQLEQQFAEKKYREMSVTAHTLKPTLNYVGIDTAVKLAESIENEGKTDSPDREKISEMIEELRDLCRRSVQELQKMRLSGM
jgi:PAS domain S-box-containing protein